MKGFLRLLLLIFTLNAFVSAEGETTGVFDPTVIEHPVLVAGTHGLVSVLPETDPHLGPLHQSSLIQHAAASQGHNASQFTGNMRVTVASEYDNSSLKKLPPHSRANVPVSIGMKLLFPEHYFW